MIGLKQRKRQEGWTTEVSNPNDERQNAGLLQRIGDNNKLWSVCLVGVLLLTALLFKQANRQGAPPQEYGGQPGYHGKGTYDDEAHRAFAENFKASKSYGSSVVSTRFVNQERFEIIAQSGVSADEIDYAARMAARIILEKFRQRVVVEVYTQELSGKRLLARTIWNPDKLGYVVKFNNDQER